MKPSEPNRVCRTCRRPLPAGHVGGSCPACVLESALGETSLDPEPSLPEDELPAVFADHEILGEIGRGGTGMVYRARHRRLGRLVALKTLHGSALGSRDAFQRLQIEAQAIARLDHPNIVPLYEVGRHAGTHFLTLRLFEQGSLADALKRRRFTPAEAARFIATAARAVHHAHSRGVLHRDLKPSNLLIDESGAPHVADFGLAKLAGGDSSLTLSTAVLGTPAYMAPEQASGNTRDAGTPADIYALGAVLYELITGRPPFVGRSALEVLRLVADVEPPRPASLDPKLDRDLEAVCLRCLEKAPGRRYASAAALAEDLDRWLRHEPLSIRPLSLGQRALKWVRRRPVIAALGLLSVLALVLGVAGVTWQWRRAEAAAREANRNAYISEINLASQAVAKGDWATVQTILQRTRPRPGQEDVRGWEWRYLWGVSRSEAVLRFATGDRRIVSLAALPDGHTLAFGEKEGGFSLWDTRSGEQVFEFPEAINRLPAAVFPLNRVATRLALIPGTRWLAYTDCRGKTNSYIRLWNIDTRAVVRSLELPGVPRDLAASPDGRYLACSTLQGSKAVHLFEVQTGRLLRIIPANFHDFAQGSPLAFSADSQRIAFEVENGATAGAAAVQLVEVGSGQEVHRFPQPQDCVVSLAFSPDGRWLAVGGGNDRPLVRIWNLQTGQLAHELTVDGHHALAFDREGHRLLAGAEVWRVPEFVRDRRLVGQVGAGVACLQADGRAYITAGPDSVVKWDLEAPLGIRRGVTIDMPVLRSDFLPQGRGVLFVSTNQLSYEALAPRYGIRPLPELGTNCLAACVIAPENRLVIGRADGRVTIHHATEYRMMGELGTGGRPVTGFWWLSRHGLLAVYRLKPEPGSAADIEVWDLKSGRRTWEAESEPWYWRWAPAEAAGISYDVYADGRLLGLDLVGHQIVRRRFPSVQTYTGAAFSPDGREVLVTYWGGQAVLDEATLRPVKALDTLRGTSHGAAIWPDGSRYLLTDCRIVDPATGRLLLELESPLGIGHRPKVSRDGSQVLLVSDSVHASRVTLWHAPSWEEIRREEAAEAGHGRPSREKGL